MRFNWFAEEYFDKPIRNRMTTDEFTIYPSEIGREVEGKTQNDYEVALTVLFRQFHPHAKWNKTDDRSNQVRGLINGHLRELYQFQEISLRSDGSLYVDMDAPLMRGQFIQGDGNVQISSGGNVRFGGRRKAKRKARAAEIVDFLGPIGGSIGTIAVQQIRAWWQKRKGMLPATQKDLSSLATTEDIEAMKAEVKAGVQEDLTRMVDSVMALQKELDKSQTPQLMATAVAAELTQQIPPAELEQAYEILDREVPEIAEEVQDLTENLEDTRPFAYWTPFGFLTIEVPEMQYNGNEFAMQYFELYTGAEGTHIEITDDTGRLVAGGRISPDARYVFPTNAGLLFKCQDRVMEIFGNRAYDATQDEKYEELYYEAAEVFGFENQIDWGSRRARRGGRAPRWTLGSQKALEILGKTRYAWILKPQEMTAQMKKLTRETPYLMYGSNGFWPTSDSQLQEIFQGDDGITDVASYIQHYGSSGEVAVYNLNTDEWFPMGLPVTKNPPSERKYKGMIIKKSGKMWNVEAFDKDFKTLKGARDFISKKVSGAASANGPCPRVIGKTKCKGTVILVRNKWKCKACKAEFREA